MPQADYRSIPADAFPFTVQVNDARTGEQLWRAEVPGPCVMDVPSWEGRQVVVNVLEEDGGGAVVIAEGTDDGAMRAVGAAYEPQR